MATGEILLNDRFESLRPGVVKAEVAGAFQEMHAQPASPGDNLGGWSTRAGGWGLLANPWRLVETPEGRFLESVATATCADNTSIAKGDHDWRDVAVETTCTLLPAGEGWGGPAGVIFRFLDSRRFYAAAVDEDGWAKLLLRVGNNWDVLASAKADVAEARPFDLRVDVAGPKIRAQVGSVELEAVDGTLPAGCVGFIGSRPCRFGPIKVTAGLGESERLAAARAEGKRCLRAKRRAHGRPVVWRKLDTRGFGTGRRIRLGDLTGDGRCDFLLLQVDSPAARGLGCMTAMSADGEVLWRLGEAKPPPEMEVSADTPAQIHDIDGDGRNEVVCVWRGEFHVLDGATGEVKATAPLPPMEPLPETFKGSVGDWGAGYCDEGPTMHASAICFADLAGRGSRRDVLLLDHYHTLAALTPQFEELWRTTCAHGHFPQVYDFDGDGRDSVLAGYQHIGPDGERIGRVCMMDHQDAIYAGPLDAERRGPVKVLMAGGDDGLLLLTPDYDIRQYVCGHVQRLSVGRFREDLPGLCVATVLFHGNPGIVSLFDSTLRKVWTRDYPVVGATLQPVNWDGTGVELMLWSGIRPSQGTAGGLLDGHGDLVVPLPDDGGPGFCALAHDFDGDGLDELMLWDYERIWIYHTDRDAPAGPCYRPLRPPLCNLSNFQSYWSLPRWVRSPA